MSQSLAIISSVAFIMVDALLIARWLGYLRAPARAPRSRNRKRIPESAFRWTFGR
jgi:hypothetical protein